MCLFRPYGMGPRKNAFSSACSGRMAGSRGGDRPETREVQRSWRRDDRREVKPCPAINQPSIMEILADSCLASAKIERTRCYMNFHWNFMFTVEPT